LTAEDVIQIALAALKTDRKLSPPEEELALLLSREADQVPDLVDALEVAGGQQDNVTAIWIFLALAWIYEHRSSFDNPFQTIDMLYADFEYPTEMESLISYMPVAPGMAVGLAAIAERWRAYLASRAEYYRTRPLAR
jgi:hypothetical protein